MNPYIEASLPFDGGLRIDYVVDEDLWQLLCSRKVGAITDLPATKARVLQGFAHGIKLDYYTCVGLDGQFEPNLHPPYTEGMSGKLYLTEVATAYQKALLKYAEDN
jgi:hypothetical protein